MPTHRVVNRRNVSSPFVRKSVLVSSQALERVAELAARLEVSQGSLIDAALRHVAELDPGDVVELLRAHGHLTDAEYDDVKGLAKTKRRSRRRTR